MGVGNPLRSPGLGGFSTLSLGGILLLFGGCAQVLAGGLIVFWSWKRRIEHNDSEFGYNRFLYND